jgi:hypothetical protein
MSISENTNPKKRGRKPRVSNIELEKEIILQQYHFKYSDEFADLLANFATEHSEDKNKEFKAAWKIWSNIHSAEIEKEITKMKQEGYQGDVAEKMYFSARYYYRKKAIREQTEPANLEEKTPRKKYESIDKHILVQMTDHIILQFNCLSEIVGNMQIVKELTPSKSFSDYCEKYNVAEDDVKIKKTYKNLYWRISKQVSTK